ncbi:hypothetical protein BTVI_45020 [Pitangus sulphuratus]|nr:hypothetical protein BTVI_45020 [Pitangus sulphuratus]
MKQNQSQAKNKCMTSLAQVSLLIKDFWFSCLEVIGMTWPMAMGRATVRPKIQSRGLEASVSPMMHKT